MKRAADEYNQIAAAAAKAGIQQGLHNEGFEVSMVDGQRTYDMLFELLDPKLGQVPVPDVDDHGGFVAAEYFTKYPGRFISMHLQDVDMNATPPPPPPGQPGRDAARSRRPDAVGKGSIDWVKTFRPRRPAASRTTSSSRTWS